MKNIARWIGLLSLVAAFAVSSVSAQEEKKGKKNKGDSSRQMVTQFLKNLEPAALSAEQKSKIEEMFGKVAKEVSTKRAEAGITADMLKKRTDVAKAARDAGKKQAELKKEVAEKSGFTGEQTKIYDETEEALAKVKIEIGKLLSEDQLAKIEDGQFKNSLKEKAKNKKKKAA